LSRIDSAGFGETFAVGNHRLKACHTPSHTLDQMCIEYDRVIPAADALSMLGDAHSTNWAENYQFFLNRNNPANFERIWKQAYMLYRRIGAISNNPVPFDQVMDFSVIQKLGTERKYAETKDEYTTSLPPKTVQQIRAENEEILTNTIVVHFFPNSAELRKKVRKWFDVNSSM